MAWAWAGGKPVGEERGGGEWRVVDFLFVWSRVGFGGGVAGFEARLASGFRIGFPGRSLFFIFFFFLFVRVLGT